MTTTEAENERLVRRLSDELNDGNVGIVDELLADEYHPSEGVTDHRERFRRLHDAFPDRHRELRRLVSDGDKVVATYRVTGTHEGELAGVEPTGERFEMYTLEWLTIDEGTIEGWLYVHEMAGAHWTDWFARHLGE